MNKRNKMLVMALRTELCGIWRFGLKPIDFTDFTSFEWPLSSEANFQVNGFESVKSMK